MLDKCCTGAYCKYFQKAVLPFDLVLEATLTGQKVPELDNCVICGKLFIPVGKQAYCSSACADTARRKRQREYMRKKRS
nr:cysteine-rich VLP domain-containing protein [Kineothrix alysoides]